jgi:hypothetical protein
VKNEGGQEGGPIFQGGQRFPWGGGKDAPLACPKLQDLARLDDVRIVPAGVDQRNFPSFSRETASETLSAMKIGAIGSF